MATTDLKIKVGVDASGAVNGANQAQAAMDRLSGALSKVAHYGVGLGLVVPQVAALVSGAAKAADAYAGLSARIAIASDGLGSATTAQAALFEVAQRTRQPLEAVADGYGKLASVGKELGLSQQDVIRTTETLSKAMALGGGSAQGQQAALLQLGQALGTGALRGDEFNSVMEQAPGLAKILADALGVPIGALRGLAEQGRLTSDLIVGALAGSAGKIDAEFAKLPATIGGAFTQLGNSFLQTIGLLDQAGGVSQKAAGAIQGLAENMGLALGGTAALGAGLLVLRTSTVAAATATTALRAGLAFLGGPVSAIATLLTLGVTAWTAWKVAGTSSEKAVQAQVTESHAEIMARIDAQIKAVEERNRKAAEGVPALKDRSAELAGAEYARLEAQRQAAMKGDGEFAGMGQAAREALVGALTRQVAEAYVRYTKASELAGDKAREAGDKLVADAGKTAQLDVDIKRQWVKDAAELSKQYSQAIELAQGDPERVAQLTRERDQRLIEGQRATNDKLAALAAGQSAKARALADAQAGLTLAQFKAGTDAELAALDDRETALAQARQAGQVGERLAADESLRIEQDRLTVKARLVAKEIELEALRQTAPGDAAAARQQEGRLVTLRAQLADVTRQIRQAPDKALASQSLQSDAPDFDPLGDAMRKGDDALAAREDARWKAALQAGEQLRASREQLSVAMIRDDEQRARAELAIEQRRLREQLDLDALGADDRKALEDELAAWLVDRNAQLAEQFKPGWRKLVDGWADVNRLMRQGHDELMQGIVKNGEDAFVQFARTGKLNVKSLVDDAINQMLRLQFRQMLGSDSGQGVLGAVSAFLRPQAATSTKGYSGQEGDASFMGPLQDLGDAATAAGARMRGAADASSALGTQAGTAGDGLGKLGNGLFGAVQAVLSFVASLSAQSASSSASGLMGLFSAASGGNGPVEGDASFMGPVMPKALGDVFGSAHRFATGGAFTNQVVDQPTPFRFADGGALRNGLMGEAGPEAVMPLDRAPGGGLGVAALDASGRQVGTLSLARGRGGRLSAVLDAASALAATGRDGPKPGQMLRRFATGAAFGLRAPAVHFATGGAFGSQGGERLAGAADPRASRDAMPPVQLTLAPVINIDARTDAAQVRQLVVQGMAQAAQQAQAAVLDTMRRNRSAFRT